MKTEIEIQMEIEMEMKIEMKTEVKKYETRSVYIKSYWKERYKKFIGVALSHCVGEVLNFRDLKSKLTY